MMTVATHIAIFRSVALLSWLIFQQNIWSSAFLVSSSHSNTYLLHQSLNAFLKEDEADDSLTTSMAPINHTASRRSFLNQACSVIACGGGGIAALISSPLPTDAFDGGVGGLGKTKPDTGVELFDESATPIQNSAGVISAEIKSTTGKPILAEFQAPWPLLPSGAFEARDLQGTDGSAFLQVIPIQNNEDWKNPKKFKDLVVDSVLSQKGKYGAYGAPIDIKVKRVTPAEEENIIYGVTFTTYTPAMRESERQVWIQPKQVYGDTLVSLIVGTTRARFASQEKQFTKIIQSYSAIAAPESKFRRAVGGS